VLLYITSNAEGTNVEAAGMVEVKTLIESGDTVTFTVQVDAPEGRAAMHAAASAAEEPLNEISITKVAGTVPSFSLPPPPPPPPPPAVPAGCC
jgi:hypothetical protein